MSEYKKLKAMYDNLSEAEKAKAEQAAKAKACNKSHDHS